MSDCGCRWELQWLKRTDSCWTWQMNRHVRTGGGVSCSSGSETGTKSRIHWPAAEPAEILLKDQLRGSLEWVT
jgi:hypothetical protein